MARTNVGFGKAKSSKNDEFYTQLTDVSKELKNYKNHFKGKVVLCNCDDPTWSAFWKYFHLNFSTLGLKKLISTHYDKNEPTYKMEYEGGNDNDIEAGVKTPLEGNGDFRNQECLDLMDESDIVVTNPPFSLFREYVTTLVEHKKKFLIIGNINCITYKEIFPLIKDNTVWLGTGMGRWISGFIVPPSYELYGTEARINENGERIVSTNNCLWLTNLDHHKRHEGVICWKNYTSEEFPTYENYDAINVNKTGDIPVDYDGVMGVPITFLDKYNPDQFEILGLDKDLTTNGKRGMIDGKQLYARIFIRKKGGK